MSPRLLPVVLEDQLLPGASALATHHLADALDLSGFDSHFRNDPAGATAHAPSMLLKAVLLAYPQGIVSACANERACRDNVLFIATAGDAKLHFTTIADFVSRSRDAIASVLARVLASLRKKGLICRKMFAIDGVKPPVDTSKYRFAADRLGIPRDLDETSSSWLPTNYSLCAMTPAVPKLGVCSVVHPVQGTGACPLDPHTRSPVRVHSIPLLIFWLVRQAIFEVFDHFDTVGYLGVAVVLNTDWVFPKLPSGLVVLTRLGT